MVLGELKARTAALPKRSAVERDDAAPPIEKKKLVGLDLAALAETPATQNAPATTALPDSALGDVPSTALAVAKRGVGSFAALRRGIDSVADVPARQQAFLRVLETFGSEWVPGAAGRALWNGTAQLKFGLSKRGLWRPFQLPRSERPVQLTPDQQEQFIHQVLAASWDQLKLDTPRSKSVPESVRGLVELHGLWESFAGGF